MHHSKKILLLLEMDFAWGRGVARGIVAFARPNLPWRFVRRPPADDSTPMDSLDADGIIGIFHHADVLRALRRMKRIIKSKQ